MPIYIVTIVFSYVSLTCYRIFLFCPERFLLVAKAVGFPMAVS